jgi:hypothetical protein
MPRRKKAHAMRKKVTPAEALEGAVTKMFFEANLDRNTEMAVLFDIILAIVEFETVWSRQALCDLAWDLCRLGMHHENNGPPDAFWEYLRATLTAHDDNGDTVEQQAAMMAAA